MIGDYMKTLHDHVKISTRSTVTKIVTFNKIAHLQTGTIGAIWFFKKIADRYHRNDESIPLDLTLLYVGKGI